MYILFICQCRLLFRFAQDNLYEEIQKHAKQYEIAPQNAMIDKIWKATPDIMEDKLIWKHPIII